MHCRFAHVPAIHLDDVIGPCVVFFSYRIQWQPIQRLIVDNNDYMHAKQMPSCISDRTWILFWQPENRLISPIYDE